MAALDALAASDLYETAMVQLGAALGPVHSLIVLSLSATQAGMRSSHDSHRAARRNEAARMA